MPIDPVTGHPHGSLAQKAELERMDEATKDAPWWVTLTSLLFVPFFWAAVYLIAGAIDFAVHLLAISPQIINKHYRLLGAAAAVVFAGYIIYRSGVRKHSAIAVLETTLGVASAAYAVVRLPEDGISAIVSIFGGVFGVADGIKRFVRGREA